MVITLVYIYIYIFYIYFGSPQLGMQLKQTIQNFQALDTEICLKKRKASGNNFSTTFCA